jgi:hypothetical protein
MLVFAWQVLSRRKNFLTFWRNYVAKFSAAQEHNIEIEIRIREGGNDLLLPSEDLPLNIPIHFREHDQNTVPASVVIDEDPLNSLNRKKGIADHLRLTQGWCRKCHIVG